jgi:glycosyltransferase involved in cell wall biosynthesis
VQKNKSTTNPKTVIVTRTKNRNLLLKRALGSVKSQSYKDFIHVIVNDGGDKDAVDRIVSKYNHKIKVIHNNESKGLIQALNQGIRSVQAKYISILDDDDSWSADRLEKTVGYLEETGAKGLVNVMDRVVEKIDGNTIKEISRNRLYDGLTTISLYEQCLDNYMTNGCFTYRRSVYDELGGYDESLQVAEDWDFGIRFLLKYDIDFLHTDHALHFYHHRPENKSFSGNSVFARREQQNRNLNILRNRYLREDIKEGRFGLGFIMNQLKYQKETILPAEIEREKQQATRLEAHINHVAELLKKQLNQELIGQMSSMIRDNRFENRVLNKAKRATKRIFLRSNL